MQLARPRVLVIAEAANPEWVSVPLVGWSIAVALRDVADVHIVTHVRNRAAFERAGLVEGANFTAIDSERVARPLWRAASWLRGGTGGGWTTAAALNAIAYPYFERLVWRRFGAAIKAGAFDLVHRVTPVSPALPSPLASRCAAGGVPFVLGPLNGGVPWPPGFDAERRREQEWLSYARGLYRLLPGRAATLRAASAILVGSRYVTAEIPAANRGKVIYLPENGLDDVFASSAPRPVRAPPLRACFIGRLVPLKGADMLLAAASPYLKAGTLLLDFVGDGPVRPALEGMAIANGVAGAVTFHGWVERALVPQVAGRASLFAFPSVKEFGGGAVLEAMALGLAPLVIDYGGPGELVTDETGFKVPIGSKTAITVALHEALGRIIADPALLEARSRRARERALSLFTWPQKAQQVREVYDWVLAGKSGAPPRFAF